VGAAPAQLIPAAGLVARLTSAALCRGGLRRSARYALPRPLGNIHSVHSNLSCFLAAEIAILYKLSSYYDEVHKPLQQWCL
jgi:hypothetical protein